MILHVLVVVVGGAGGDDGSWYLLVGGIFAALGPVLTIDDEFVGARRTGTLSTPNAAGTTCRPRFITLDLLILIPDNPATRY